MQQTQNEDILKKRKLELQEAMRTLEELEGVSKSPADKKYSKTKIALLTFGGILALTASAYTGARYHENILNVEKDLKMHFYSTIDKIKQGYENHIYSTIDKIVGK